MADQDQDPIAELVDWQEHQYSPGQWIKSDYWRNRLSHSSSPERPNRIWGMIPLEFLIIIPTFLFAIYAFFVERNPYYLILMGVLGEYSIAKTLLVFKMKPPQKEQNEGERKNKKKKKRELPKRPKNYR